MRIRTGNLQERGHRLIEDPDDLGLVLAVIRQLFQRVHKSHAVPAHRTAPEMLGEARRLISPGLLARIIIRMIQEPRLCVQCMFTGNDELMRNIIIFIRILAELADIFRIERRTHIEPIQPDLFRIDFLMPEHAFLGTRMMLNLAAKQIQCLLVLFFMGLLVDGQQDLAVIQMIDVVFIHTVAADCAIFLYECICAGLYVIKVRVVTGLLPDLGDAIQRQTELIGPVARQICLAFHHGICHPF